MWLKNDLWVLLDQWDSVENDESQTNVTHRYAAKNFANNPALATSPAVVPSLPRSRMRARLLSFFDRNMDIREVFLNEAGRLRSGFRFTIFFAAYIALSILFEGSRPAIHAALQQANSGLAPHIDQLVFRIGLLLAALLTGWACNFWFEGLPWRALGLTSHQHWSRDLVVGSAIGSVSLLCGANRITGKAYVYHPPHFAWLPVHAHWPAPP